MSNTEVKPEETPSLEKRSLVELRNGKVILKQKPLSLEKMSETMQEIVQFRAFMGSRAKEGLPPPGRFPEEHLSLIAKFTHENDRTLGALARHIHAALQPGDLETELETAISREKLQIPLDVIENAILRVADRVNYGMDWLSRPSASLSTWRWELKEDSMKYLSQGMRDKLEIRVVERRQAKKDLRSLYSSLSQSEKDNLTKGSKKGKEDGPNVIILDFDDINNNETDTVAEIVERDEASPGTTKGLGRQKKEKAIDPDRIAKEKEKAERKAAKAERERKEKEAESKSRSIMTAFFNKQKTANNSQVELSKGLASPSKADPSPPIPGFERTFKPFVIKKDAFVAPVNHFEWRKQRKEVIVIDQANSQNSGPVERINTIGGSSNPEDILDKHLRAIPAEFNVSRRSRRSKSLLKTSTEYCVRDIMSQLSEAEIVGDATTVRRLHALLCDRSKIPAKVLIFHEDTRPGYFGTFTKSSTKISARNPFAKDAVAFDYSYDSGEEWEEEEEGGEDVVSNDGSEDETGEVDSDLDDWLVEDDEGEDPGTPASERRGSPSPPLPQLPSSNPPRKRKTISSEKKETKKRKVTPLMPFIKGPFHEDEIGHCSYEPFTQYRIQLFNDTPYPIDPFTFVSTLVTHDHALSSKLSFAVPAPPTHVGQGSGSFAMDSGASAGPTPAGTSADSVMILPVKRKAALAAKTPFPDALMPFLADKVTTLATGNLIWLIESLYQELKAHKVKKVSIEAKVREVVEKCPSKKIWIVKNDVLNAIGRPTISAANNG